MHTNSKVKQKHTKQIHKRLRQNSFKYSFKWKYLFVDFWFLHNAYMHILLFVYGNDGNYYVVRNVCIDDSDYGYVLRLIPWN